MERGNYNKGFINGRTISLLAKALRQGLKDKVCTETAIVDWSGQLQPHVVAALTKKYLAAQPGVSPKCVRHVEAWLKTHNLSFKPDVEPVVVEPDVTALERQPD